LILPASPYPNYVGANDHQISSTPSCSYAGVSDYHQISSAPSYPYGSGASNPHMISSAPSCSYTGANDYHQTPSTPSYSYGFGASDSHLISPAPPCPYQQVLPASPHPYDFMTSTPISSAPPPFLSMGASHEQRTSPAPSYSIGTEEPQLIFLSP